MGKRVLVSQVKQMEKLHEEGHSHVAIAQQLGIGRNTVARHLAGDTPPAANDDVVRLGPLQLKRLSWLLAAVEAWPCPACQRPLVAVKTMARVVCACGTVQTHSTLLDKLAKA